MPEDDPREHAPPEHGRRSAAPHGRGSRHTTRWILIASAVVVATIVTAAVTRPSPTLQAGTSSELLGPTVPRSLAPRDIVVWQDDFVGPEGSSLDADAWMYQTGGGGWGNNELQTYTEANGVLDGRSDLVITAQIDQSLPPGQQYTSARVVTTGTFTYGRLEARIKLPEGPGLLPAFWLLGADIESVGYPASGEIDVVETPHGTRHSAHSLHAPTPDGAGHGQHTVDIAHSTPLSAGFHIYAVDRTPNHIQISIDGEVVADLTPQSVSAELQWVFEKPFHALFSLAIGGNWPGPPTAATPQTSEMVIDWIRLIDPQ